MTRNLIPGILAMATIVVASNILVQFLYGQWLTFGAFTYPFSFLVTDLTNRLQGAKAARTVVIAGFVVGVACSLIGSQIAGQFGPPDENHRRSLPFDVAGTWTKPKSNLLERFTGTTDKTKQKIIVGESVLRRALEEVKAHADEQKKEEKKK